MAKGRQPVDLSHASGGSWVFLQGKIVWFGLVRTGLGVSWVCLWLDWILTGLDWIGLGLDCGLDWAGFDGIGF